VITLADARAGEASAENRLSRQSLSPRLSDLSGRKLEYLTAIAVNGGRAATGALAATLGRTPQDLSWLRDELIRDGDVYGPTRGYVALSVPVFGRFLLANYEAARELSDTQLLPIEEMAVNQQGFLSRQFRRGSVPPLEPRALPGDSEHAARPHPRRGPRP
jgi:hypothetical protein